MLLSCLSRIRKSLSLDLVKQIAVILASSKLDYCNSLFHNMSEKDIDVNRFVVHRIETETGSRAFSISGPAFQYVLPKQS